MKKPLLITIGITLVLLVLGVWAYLIMFGSPDSSSDVFSDLGFDIVAQPTTPIPADNTPLLPVEEIVTSDSALQQLTTREVAGFVILENGNASKVRLAEVGTGHIYDIVLNTRAETRVSGTTIPQVVSATFSNDGTEVALTQIASNVSETFVGELATSSENSALEGTYLLPNARDIYFTEGAVFYTVSSKVSTEGFSFRGSIGTQERLFSIPFSAVTMVWQETGSHFFFNRPTASLAGTLFELSGNSFSPVIPAKLGRSAMVTPDYYVSTYAEADQLLAESYDTSDDRSQQLAITTIPEKCVPDKINSEVLWCAAPFETLSTNHLEDWYKGAVNSDDVLWELQLTSGEAILEADFEILSSRLIDAIGLASDSATSQLIFINKLDRTLWLYDLLAQ